MDKIVYIKFGGDLIGFIRLCNKLKALGHTFGEGRSSDHIEFIVSYLVFNGIFNVSYNTIIVDVENKVVKISNNNFDECITFDEFKLKYHTFRPIKLIDKHGFK